MANKTFNTRVKNKRDTAANWEAVATTFQPLDGELIIVDTSAGKTRFKVGRYDTAKGRLLYYNEIPFADEYLYNDLNESQGKIYDKLKGIDDKSIIEMTLEPSGGNGTTVCVYNIGLWQFPQSGYYKLKLSKLGTTNNVMTLYARKTKDDGTTPEDFSNDNMIVISQTGSGDGKSEYIFVLADYLDDEKQTCYKIQFLNFFGFANAVYVNTYDKTTQKWAHNTAYQTKLKDLILKKGDTSTRYNGKESQTVEIPTKTSELTNDSFVSYAEQVLTKDQQNQAKTNLGIDVLTGNTTAITPTQVKEAILAGRPIAITYTDTIYGNLTFTSFGYSVENNVVVANLVAISYSKYILADLTGNSNNNNWTLQTTELGTSTNIANNYVKYSESQTLTDEQKATARTNIGAISEAELVQSDWNQNNTTASDYIKNRPGGYYSVVNSVDSGTLTTTDFAKLSSEGSGIVGYIIPNETFNTALQNLNVTAGKTYKISWVDNGQAFSYISEAVDLVKTEGSVTYHNICIFGDTIVNLTAAELIWGKTAKVIFLSNSVATATNTVTNVKVEEVNVVKIPKALVESDSIEEFDLSNNYTATNKGSIKYIKTDRQDSTTHYALLGFENEGNLYPKLKVSGQELDTSYVNTTEYSSGSIKSSWVDHSETGDTFIHGIDINHDRYNKALILQSELLDNTTEDLSVRGIATPTADNDAVNKKYVDDVKNDVAANYVKFTAEQTLTDEQKALARENINAPSPADAVYTATASSTDGVAYTATVSGIDSLTVGASFIMIPNKASTSKAPTLNVNGLGAKPIRRRLSSLTTSLQQGYSTNWIALNKPFTVVYDGTAWVIEGLTKTDGADVYGAVAQATADAKGNNIADTYATIAMLQSMLPKVTTITLTSNWVGDASPYYQDIALSCVTETSIVDLQPTPEQLNSWQDDGIAFTTLSGNGTVRVYVAGGKPSSAISVQIRVQEVTVI